MCSFQNRRQIRSYYLLRTSRNSDNGFRVAIMEKDLSVDQFFFPEKVIAKTTQRRQLDALLDNISENGLRIITAVSKEIADTEQKNSLK